MKMIKPIVNVSKVADAYDAVLCGFNGVLHDGVSFRAEALEALLYLYKSGKKIVLLSNDCRRVEDLVRLMHQNGFSPRLFSAMVTAGEILHHHLAAGRGVYASLGKTAAALTRTAALLCLKGWILP